LTKSIGDLDVVEFPILEKLRMIPSGKLSTIARVLGLLVE
jgi:hypothetical protein